MKNTIKHAVRAPAVALAAAGLVALGSGAASAHVTVDPDVTTAGSYSVLAFAFGHGCEGSATTQIAIKVPEELVTVTPTIHAGWTVEKVMETLPTPVDDGYGGQYTERVAEVVYSADAPVADGYRQALEVQAHLPEEAGGTLYFPVVQTCEVGETAWVQIPQEGQDPEELEAPAPSISITGSAADVEGGAAMSEDAEAVSLASISDASAAEASASPVSEQTSPVSWAALALGAGGLVLGGAAFARSRAKA